jgi:signal transduction histidine kinase
MPDSYDLLAKSIERVIRSDLPPPASEAELAQSIDRIMLDEARAASERIAWLRVAIVAPLLPMALVEVATERRVAAGAGATPAATLSAAALATWLAAALVLALVLKRGWYRRWVPHVVPAADALMIVAGLVAPMWIEPGPASPAALASVVAPCAFVALAGGLRLSRFSARVGTALSAVVFLLAAAAYGLAPLAAGAIAVALVGIGLLASSVMAIVRRMVADEVAKATLAQMFGEATLKIRAREQVLKVVSHDLRNPLHTIELTLGLLLEDPVPPEKQQEHLRRVQRAGRRADRLVHDPLDVLKLQAGSASIAPRPVDVEPLLREAHDGLVASAAEHELALELDVASDLPRITADPDRVQQVISNLVGNAIKFTPKGGRIVLRARRVPAGVEFAVSDTGPGIPADQVGKIFHDLWQGDPSDKRGMGLGLTIAKGIVDAHGGRLWVESEVGVGTTFLFVLGGAVPGGVSTTHTIAAAPVAREARP